MNDSRELSCVIKNYLRPAIVEASFRKGSWFLTKILPKIYVPQVTNDTKTSVLVFSAEFFLKHFDIERFTALREYAISIGLSVFHH